MTKKEIAKRYIEENVDFKGLKAEINGDKWLRTQNVGLLACNGLVFTYFYEVEQEAIKKAGWVNPGSDRTYLTIVGIRKELLNKYL